MAAATNTVCSGEILQTQRRRNFELSRAEYFKVLQMKTGELFALSCDLGAYLSGATSAQRSALRHFGMSIGTAYQVYDDCLDLFGSEAAVGKSLGTDMAKGKLTLPLLLALERTAGPERERIKSMVVDWKPDYLGDLVEILKRHQTLEDSQQVVLEHLDAARVHLSVLPESESNAGLSGLVDYLAHQTVALGTHG